MRRDAAISVALFALNVALNVPLFESGESRYRDSIAGGYASMARFFHDHPNPWGWNRLEYGGLPSQFTYLPGLPYAAALAMHATTADPPDVYNRVAAALALAGPSTLFLFVVYATRSRKWALAVALAYTFCSPCYGLIHTIARDRGFAYLPWRLQVLVKYGEGPHNAGLTLIPLALICVWRAARGRGIVPAALLLAAVALTNWIAALSLAFAVVMLIAAMAGAPDFRWRRVIAAGALGYSIACAWLTPTFVRTIAFNWPQDAFQYRFGASQEWLLAALALGLVAIRYLLRAHRYLCFVSLCCFGFAWVVVHFYSTGVTVIPEARRYAVEFEMFLLLAVVEYLRLTIAHANSSVRIAGWFPAVMLATAGLAQIWTLSTQGFAARHPIPKEQTIEWKLASALADLQPEGRVFASGGLRFRLNSWFPIEQAGGVFESGLTDRSSVDLAYRIRTATDPGAAVEGLQRLGVEYVVVHGPRSREHYRDFRNPRLFDGALDRVAEIEDDRIYRVPHERRWRWTGDTALEVATPAPVELIRVRYEDGWTASSGAVARGPDGWIELRGANGPATLRYTGTLEQRLCALISALAIIYAVYSIAIGRKAVPATAP